MDYPNYVMLHLERGEVYGTHERRNFYCAFVRFTYFFRKLNFLNMHLRFRGRFCFHIFGGILESSREVCGSEPHPAFLPTSAFPAHYCLFLLTTRLIWLCQVIFLLLDCNMDIIFYAKHFPCLRVVGIYFSALDYFSNHKCNRQT